MTKTITVEKEVWESTLKASMDRAGRIEILEQQLAIAVEALEFYAGYKNNNISKRALQQIKELEKCEK